MNKKIKCLLIIAGISMGLTNLISTAYAEPGFSNHELPGKPLNKQSAAWWQYIFSIPATTVPPSVNPILDTTGENCVVGQRGQVWFLAGAFFGQGTITRDCKIPEGKSLFFPAINYFFVDTPGVCGQGNSVPVDEMRSQLKACLDGVTEVSVKVDGAEVKHLRRVKSVVFEATFPEDNIFDEPCVPNGFPGGTYSPGVDEGYYAMLKPLSLGSHVIRIRATAPSCQVAGPVSQDVTYNITVVPTPGVK
jgi:hypothetical protein